MTTVYVGNLREGTDNKTIEDLFATFGRVENVDLKGAFGFVVMAEDSAAQEAISKLNGADCNGNQLTVQPSKPKDKSNTRQNNANPRKCVIVENLNYQTSWQDLKDHFKRVAEVAQANIDMRGGKPAGTGVVEMRFYEDVPKAVQELDGSELGGRRIRCRAQEGGASGGRGGGGGGRPAGGYERRDDRGGARGGGSDSRYHPYERPRDDDRPRGEARQGYERGSGRDDYDRPRDSGRDDRSRGGYDYADRGRDAYADRRGAAPSSSGYDRGAAAPAGDRYGDRDRYRDDRYASGGGRDAYAAADYSRSASGYGDRAAYDRPAYGYDDRRAAYPDRDRYDSAAGGSYAREAPRAGYDRDPAYASSRDRPAGDRGYGGYGDSGYSRDQGYYRAAAPADQGAAYGADRRGYR